MEPVHLSSASSPYARHHRTQGQGRRKPIGTSPLSHTDRTALESVGVLAHGPRLMASVWGLHTSSRFSPDVWKGLRVRGNEHVCVLPHTVEQDSLEQDMVVWSLES